MRITIVYDSRTGTTKAAAEEMAQLATAAGHEVSVVAVQAASAAEVSSADAVCVGSWTEGLFFILQHATKATMEFIDSLELDGAPSAVFCTYKTSPGKMLDKMAEALEARGAKVTARLRSRGPYAPEGFKGWLDSLTKV
ncbi:MAG: flavodoxin family protein [Acidimicrobiia bacterium]